MSISIGLVPIALAMRAVMGADGYARWVASMQVQCATTFENEIDLVRTLKRAGYDVETWGGALKTRLPNGHIIIWQLVDGRWIATIGKEDADVVWPELVRDVEAKTGRRIVGSAEDAQVLPRQETRSFPTNFRDRVLLLRTLNTFGANPVSDTDGSITCTLGKASIRFSPDSDGVYTVDVDEGTDMQGIFQQLSALDVDYRRGVQAAVYDSLKKRVAEKGMTVESEEVLDDDSILITLAIPG